LTQARYLRDMTPARSAKIIAGIFAVSGVVHLVKPEVYEPLIPDWLPGAREIVLGSGVAELVCAAGLAHPRTRGLAGWASAALLVGVFPGNVQMAVDALGTDNTALKVGSVVRLPLQVPLVVLAVRAARGDRRTG
jgi:uncharacterized membrane protein